MSKAKRLYLKVFKEIDGEKGDDTLIDLTLSDDGSYEVNKIVFYQLNLETEESHWVVFPKEYYSFRLEVLKEEIAAAIQETKSDPNYPLEEYHKIISSTRRKMIFQDRG